MKTAEDSVGNSGRIADSGSVEMGPSAFKCKLIEEQVKDEIKRVFYTYFNKEIEKSLSDLQMTS